MIHLFKQALLLAFLSAPVMAIAHPGHDASHWSANWLHLAYYGSLLVAMTFLTAMVFKRLKALKIKNK